MFCFSKSYYKPSFFKVHCGNGIALIDLDQGQLNVKTSLITGCSCSGEDGILSCLTPQLIDDLTPFLKVFLHHEDFKKLDLDQLKMRLNDKTMQFRANFGDYLKKHRISIGKEKVKFSSFWSSNSYFEMLQDRINTISRK